jgi:hypothetical protein
MVHRYKTASEMLRHGNTLTRKLSKSNLFVVIRNIYLAQHNDVEPDFDNDEEYRIDVSNLALFFTSTVQNSNGETEIEKFNIVELRGTLDENVFVIDDINDETRFIDLGTDECVDILSALEKYAKSIGVDIVD